ncbi:MAG: PhoH family protein [Bacteroidales bacterium]
MLKIVSRGNEIRVSGDQPDIDRLVERLEMYRVRIRQNAHQSRSGWMSFSLDPGGGKRDGREDQVLLHGKRSRPIKALTINQQRLVEEGERNDLLLAVGPAGTGKTYTAIAMAVRALKERDVSRIILTRPPVEMGARIFARGYEGKAGPVPPAPVRCPSGHDPRQEIAAIHGGRYRPRLRHWPTCGDKPGSAFVILDEAGNTRHSSQFRYNTAGWGPYKFVVIGDDTQVDLPSRRI